MQLPANLPVDTVLLILYHYLPNKAAAIAAVVLYAAISVAVTAVSVKTKAYYMLTVAVTGFLELAGWSTRLVMLSKPEMNTYIIHQALLIISPVLLAIVEYITLSRLLALDADRQPREQLRHQQTGNKDHRRVFSRVVTWCFTASDIFCLLLQSTGGAMYAQPERAPMARLLLLIGLGAQLVFFSAFIVLVAFVQFSSRFGFKHDSSFRSVFICLYATTLLMHMRNAFRVAEFAGGFDGPLTHAEYWLFVFDFMPIYACFLFFTFLHYGFWLGRGAPAMVASQATKPQATAVTVMPVLHVHCT